MEIYILRHGIAADAPGERDAERALTAEGRRKLKEVLARARAGGVTPDLILTSPLRRAIETARLAAEELGYKGEIVQTRALMPPSAPEDVWVDLQAHREDRVLISGHEPQFGELLSWLLNSPYMCVDFKKGALARVDAERTQARPKGVLKWFLTPKLAGSS